MSKTIRHLSQEEQCEIEELRAWLTRLDQTVARIAGNERLAHQLLPLLDYSLAAVRLLYRVIRRIELEDGKPTDEELAAATKRAAAL